MSEIKAIERLRDELKVCGCDPDECMTCDIPRKVKDGLAEIEHEVTVRYMPLPCDADGVPVRVGDRLVRIAYDGIIYTVNELMFDGRCWWYESGDDCFSCEGSRHKPRTLEDIIYEIALGSVESVNVVSGAPVLGIDRGRLAEGLEIHADEIRAMFGEFDDD